MSEQVPESSKPRGLAESPLANILRKIVHEDLQALREDNGPYFTIKEVAIMLRLTPYYVRKVILMAGLRTQKIGRRVFIRYHDFRVLVDRVLAGNYE